MWNKAPYDVVKSRYVTEKGLVLETLKDRNSNPSIARCQVPKYVFIVDKRANKQQIAEAVEEIYAERNVRVMKVNTSHIKPKPRRVRGRAGMKAGFKKAVVTLQVGDTIE
jgi:large subunit ribosomal protein L23